MRLPALLNWRGVWLFLYSFGNQFPYGTVHIKRQLLVDQKFQLMKLQNENLSFTAIDIFH